MQDYSYLTQMPANPWALAFFLSRLHRNDTERVIAYGSRSLNEQEKNSCGTRVEMLALVNNVDHFRYYLVGQKIAPED